MTKWTLQGFMNCSQQSFREEGGRGIFTDGETVGGRRSEQKGKVDEEVGHLQLLKRDKPLKCLSVN